MSQEYTKHPAYGYLTKEEYEQMKRCGAESTKYYKDLQAKRAKEAKKKKASK